MRRRDFTLLSAVRLRHGRSWRVQRQTLPMI
jgi:hypothetical protein